MQATLIEDKNVPGAFRVEAIDDDGGCEVAIFSGPRAVERAVFFASHSDFYDGWSDPEGHALWLMHGRPEDDLQEASQK